MLNPFRYPVLLISACAVLFFSDRLGKLISQLNVNTNVIINKCFAFGYYPNQGIGFGIQMNKTIIIVTSVIIILGLAGWLVHVWNKEYAMQAWGISFIVAGATNNLLDRIFFGHVIDYIKLFDWSLFNLADVMIVVGLIIVLLGLHKPEKNDFTKN
ncbi:signal peptidase II [Patescibacteria group bacterium]|nr:signal peptidase II [Patescibacteria group bacterium]MBU1889862.1 signal peptidase II [Patescibacteria group bacterium]